MNKAILSLLLLVPLATPAMADIRWPNTAGADYCRMRERGVSHDSALEMAISDNWDPDYESPQITLESGRVTDKDSYEMADYIYTMCPELFGN